MYVEQVLVCVFACTMCALFFKSLCVFFPPIWCLFFLFVFGWFRTFDRATHSQSFIESSLTSSSLLFRIVCNNSFKSTHSLYHTSQRKVIYVIDEHVYKFHGASMLITVFFFLFSHFQNKFYSQVKFRIQVKFSWEKIHKFSIFVIVFRENYQKIGDFFSKFFLLFSQSKTNEK